MRRPTWSWSGERFGSFWTSEETYPFRDEKAPVTVSYLTIIATFLDAAWISGEAGKIFRPLNRTRFASGPGRAAIGGRSGCPGFLSDPGGPASAPPGSSGERRTAGATACV